MEITLTIRDVENSNVEFDWHELEELMRDPELAMTEDKKITGALIVCLCLQRMMQASLIQPMSMIACQDVIQKLRSQQMNTPPEEVTVEGVDAPPTGE